ncbi:hypothetical protein MTR_3g044960 [Medicago truncatula]|uniref:Uncharacterized protein n=1 Tax=Medicago truncatula TaxID=3880 RepID=A0A072UUK6_MEDTR|nr:hypothetical protein MTR_3g044960 [Medicago truncatula]
MTTTHLVLHSRKKVALRRDHYQQNGRRMNLCPRLDEHIGGSTAHPKDPPSKTSSKKRRPNSSMVVIPEVVEEHAELEASEPAPYVGSPGTWRSKLATFKSSAEDSSLWDVEFPFNHTLNEVSNQGDKAKMKKLVINESLKAMRAYSLWTSALANSTERLCLGQRQEYLDLLQSLKDKITPLEERCAELENSYNHATSKLAKAESDLQLSSEKYQALEKAKTKIQSLMVAA